MIFEHPFRMDSDETTNPDINPALTNGDLTVVGSDLIYRQQKISLPDVIAIKYGWLPIRLDMYTIGGRYKIELKTANQTVKLNFRSYFGFFKKRQEDNFYAILDVIWDMTVVRLLNKMVDDIDAGKSVCVGECVIDRDGILYNGFLIRWDDLLYQKNYNKLTLNSKSDPSVWTNLYYAETDNVHILMFYLEWKFENGS